MSSFKYLGIIQARMGSERLPGKTMMQFAGKAALQHLIESVLNALETSNVVVATTIKDEDNPIEELANSLGVQVFRGDPINVASRYYALCVEHKPGAFIRLNGDSPLHDYRTILEAMARYEERELDLVSTVGHSKYPSGMNVEIVRGSRFVKEYVSFKAPRDFEHVTPYFYETVRFKSHSLVCPIKNSERYKFSLDTPEDAERIAKIFKEFNRPHYEYSLKEKCEIYDRLFGETQ